jgi:hypothetical protein
MARTFPDAYIEHMAETHEFTGTIVRVEPDGFGIVHFNEPIGVQANTYGIFSTTIGSTVPYGPALKPGAQVAGTAEADQNDLAAVKTLQITLA